MSKQQHSAVLRKDYQPPPYLIEEVFLTFKLDPVKTQVIATSRFRINKQYLSKSESLVLNGEKLSLIAIAIDGLPLAEHQYRLDEDSLEILQPADEFELQVITEINPQGNSSLSGLYLTSGNYCTQCEAEGFRRITYYLDRPDVLARFTTRIEADGCTCPVLLSNGNLVKTGKVDANCHFSVWQDPFPKPSYLFALVAGDLVCLTDSFITRSGRNITLQIFVEYRNRLKCDHAMHSLKKAMRWDEEVYGLEYDLESYMIVAVDDFNMGAMENKGLNVFNSKYVLASPESATDQDYLGIEGVIAHEYFHNWTGNRVTCRDWFQLSLKEGLTVFRDQEFSADMNSRASKRIDDVKLLRNFQFREDSGPMAHPVRPDSYVEINNFYTVTVYNKGAEVIRMLHRLLGYENFRKGMDLYFLRFDGQAVTCEDFVQAMSDASATDLDQFKLWYEQSGTPMLLVKESWQEASGTYTLRILQSCPLTPGQLHKKPFHIPVEIGLLDTRSEEATESEGRRGRQSHKIELREREHTYVFNGFKDKPILSFLRDFTAPVKVIFDQPRQELAFLMAQDDDLFNRWDSATRLSTEIIKDILNARTREEKPAVDSLFLEAFRHNLNDDSGDKTLVAQALTLPAETYIAQQMEVVDPEAIHAALEYVKATIARELKDDLIAVYYRNNCSGAYQITPEAMGQRNLKNCCLSYLMTNEIVDEGALAICMDQFANSNTMTDTIAALSALSHYAGPERDSAFRDFYNDWKQDPLVLDKWFSLQATSCLESTLSVVGGLMNHRDFSLKNPNKVRSLIGAFCSFNHVRFHDGSGAGYRFLSEQVLKVDALNPQIAARLVTAFASYKNYTEQLKMLMQEQLEFLISQKNLSADVYEIINKCLGAEN